MLLICEVSLCIHFTKNKKQVQCLFIIKWYSKATKSQREDFHLKLCNQSKKLFIRLLVMDMRISLQNVVWE